MPPKSYHCHCASYACAGEVWQRRTIAKHVSVDRTRAEELLALAAARGADGKQRPRLPDALEKALAWGERCFDKSNEVEDPVSSSSLMNADALARAGSRYGGYPPHAYDHLPIGGPASSSAATAGKRPPHRRPIIHAIGGGGEPYARDGSAAGGSYHSHAHHRRRFTLENADEVDRLAAHRRHSRGGRRRSTDNDHDVGGSGSDESESSSAGEDVPGRVGPAATRPVHGAFQSPSACRPSAPVGFPAQAIQPFAHHPAQPQQPQLIYGPPQPQPWAQHPPRPQQQHWAAPPPPLPQIADRPFAALPPTAQQFPSSVPSSYPTQYPLQRYDFPLGPAPPVPRRQTSLPSPSSSVLSLAAPSLPGSLLPKPLAAFRPTPPSSDAAGIPPLPQAAIWDGHGSDDAAAGERRKRKDSAASLDSDQPRSRKRSRSSTHDEAAEGTDAGQREAQSPPVAPASTAGSEASAVAVLLDAALPADAGDAGARDLQHSPSAMSSSSSSSSEEEGSMAPPSVSSRRSSHSSGGTGSSSSRSSRRRGHRRRSADKGLHLPSISDLLRLAPYAPSMPTDAHPGAPTITSPTLALGAGVSEGDVALTRASAVAGLTHGELLANPLYRSLVECVQLVAQGRA